MNIVKSGLLGKICGGDVLEYKTCFSLLDVPENLRKCGILYCCCHKVKTEHYCLLDKKNIYFVSNYLIKLEF